MNLQNIVSGVVQAISPALLLTVQRSTGYTKNADFTRAPTYATTTLQGQVQALSSDEMKQVDSLNIQGEKLAIYANGALQGVIRPANTGGDLITLPDGSIWLVIVVLENWARIDGWTKVACARQNA